MDEPGALDVLSSATCGTWAFGGGAIEWWPVLGMVGLCTERQRLGALGDLPNTHRPTEMLKSNACTTAGDETDVNLSGSLGNFLLKHQQPGFLALSFPWVEESCSQGAPGGQRISGCGQFLLWLRREGSALGPFKMSFAKVWKILCTYAESCITL